MHGYCESVGFDWLELIADRGAWKVHENSFCNMFHPSASGHQLAIEECVGIDLMAS